MGENESGSGGGDRYHIDDVAFIGRTFGEYRRLFDLDPESLRNRSVLDCPAGACSFVAEARERGVEAVGVDPLYGPPAFALARRADADVDRAMAALDGVEQLYRWDHYDDVADLRAHRERAARRFVTDYARHPGRYVAAALPRLPFPDDAASLVLSAHLLFLYDDRLDHAFHRAALEELVRVAADELRMFPLVGFGTDRYDRLDDLLATLRGEGHRARVAPVPFEFQRGADEMLVVEPR